MQFIRTNLILLAEDTRRDGARTQKADGEFSARSFVRPTTRLFGAEDARSAGLPPSAWAMRCVTFYGERPRPPMPFVDRSPCGGSRHAVS
jgi:hypothetical protein